MRRDLSKFLARLFTRLRQAIGRTKVFYPACQRHPYTDDGACEETRRVADRHHAHIHQLHKTLRLDRRCGVDDRDEKHHSRQRYKAAVAFEAVGDERRAEIHDDVDCRRHGDVKPHHRRVVEACRRFLLYERRRESAVDK